MDIRRLGEGASQREGLGNQFLHAHPRSGRHSRSRPHVRRRGRAPCPRWDRPVRDIEVIDLRTRTRGYANSGKLGSSVWGAIPKGGDHERNSSPSAMWLRKLVPPLQAGKAAAHRRPRCKRAARGKRVLHLLTMKPVALCPQQKERGR